MVIPGLKTRNLYSTLFFFIWCLFNVSSFLLQQTELRYIFSTDRAYRMISFVIVLSLVILVLLWDKITLKNMLFYAGLCLLILMIVYVSGEDYLILALGFIITGTKVDFHSFVRWDLCIKAVLLVLIVGLCLLGFIPNFAREINGTFKQALGFTHPNTLTAFAMTMICEWMYLRYDKFCLLDLFGIVSCVFIIANVSAARSSIIAIFGALIMIVLIKMCPKFFERKLIQYIVCVFPCICTLLSFWLVRIYETDFGRFINTVFSSRIVIAKQNLDYYGLSVFGAEILGYGTRTARSAERLFFNVDMDYIMMPLKYGIVFLIIILIGYFCLIKEIFRHKEYALLPVIMCFVIQGFGESYFHRIQYNFTLLLLLAYLNRDYVAQSVSLGRNYLLKACLKHE